MLLYKYLNTISRYRYIKPHRLIYLLLVFLMNINLSACERQTYHNPQAPKAALAGAVPKSKIYPIIPQASRHSSDKVFIENSDLLIKATEEQKYQVLKGNVRFSSTDRKMSCDSAYYYPEEGSLDAFSNVHLSQGTMMDVTTDKLHYYGPSKIASLRYNVRMKNGNLLILTDSLDYDFNTSTLHYFDGGTVLDEKKNKITSNECYYDRTSQQAQFIGDVVVESPKFTLRSSKLDYNASTRIATIVAPTTITTPDGDQILTDKGTFNTYSDIANLYNRSQIQLKDGRTMIADTLYYNKQSGFGTAKGAMHLYDPKNKIILEGDYGEHSERTQLSFATGNALAKIFQRGDTLYVHADTLRADNREKHQRIIKAIHHVKFYRTDVQGVCDTATIYEQDSTLHLVKHAILWNANKQINGQRIIVFMKDSTVDHAVLPQSGTVAEHIGEQYYNQLSGKKIIANFEDKEIRKVQVDGNVRFIMFPQEKDSTYNKCISAESSYMTVDLKPKQVVDKIKLWPEVNGKIIPLPLAKNSDLLLSDFHPEYFNYRPSSPLDVLNVSPELRQFIDSEETSHQREIQTRF